MMWIMSDLEEWFGVEAGQGEPDRRLARFRHALRSHADGWKNLGIGPEDTWFTGGYAGVVLTGVTCPVRELHLDYSFHRLRGPRLLGEWADEHIFDGSDNDADLVVRGVDLSPTRLGAIAARWIEMQLRVPVVRQEWMTAGGLGEPTVERRRWMASGTDLIHDDASWPLRLTTPRRPPDRVIDERPDRRSAGRGGQPTAAGDGSTCEDDAWS